MNITKLLVLLLVLASANCATAQLKADTVVAPTGMMLRPVVVSGHRSTIKQDSLEVRNIYKKHFQAAEHRPTVSLGGTNGLQLGVTGLFSDMAYRISGKRKRGRKFKEQFLTDLQDRRIDTRVTPVMVATATGLTDPDTVSSFLASCHLPYELANTATDLELMQWLRQEYKSRYAVQVRDSLKSATANK